MKILFIISLTCFAQLTSGQYRMTHTPETSMLSENNSNCIAGDGDAVHVVWYEEYEGQFYAGVYHRRSLDNGNTWEDATYLGYGLNPSIAVQGNEVHVVFGDGLVQYQRSMDNGSTWEYIPLPDNEGDHPSLAVSGSQVHLVWHGGSNGNIEYCRSDDRGSTWSAIQVISDRYQASFPSIAINDPYVHIVFQDEDGIVYHRSDDNGNTWPLNSNEVWEHYQHPSIAVSGRIVVITATLHVSWSMMTVNSTDHGNIWNIPKFPFLIHGFQAILSNHLTSHGNLFFITWNQRVNDTWSILTTHSNDGGFTWSAFGEVSPITGYFSCRPFALLKGKDIHLVATDNIHAGGKHEIFYHKEEDKLIELGRTHVDWGFSIGNDRIETCNDIAVDDQGYVYTTGYFVEEIDMDPRASEWILTSIGSTDVFIAKYDPDGHLVWARRIGGQRDDIGKSINLDAQGNIYIAGGFENLVNFDPEGEGVHIFGRGDQDIFILRLNNDGEFLSCFAFGDDGTDSPEDISISKSGNIIFTGLFSGTVDFNRFGYYPLTSNGSNDIFLCILDAEGKFISAQAIGGRQPATPEGLVMDSHDNIYMTGTFKDTIDVMPGSGVRELISKGGNDAFVLAVDSLGQYRWSGSLGSAGADDGHDVAIDSSGHLILVGKYNGILSIETDAMQSTLPNNDVYLVKLEHEGDILWKKAIVLTGNGQLHVSTSGQDHINLVGSYTGVGTNQQTEYSFSISQDADDLLWMKYNSDGEFLWLSEYGGPGYSYVHAAAGNGVTAIYMAGTYNKELFLDPGNLTEPLSDPPGNPSDFFLTKMVECIPTYVHLAATACEIYIAPNGVTEWTSTGTYQQTIQSSHGCDSIIMVELTILEPSMSSIDAFTCDIYTSPTGKVLSETGLYRDTLTNIAGCDSILSINLIVQRETHIVDDIIACESFQTPEGSVITTTGTISDTLSNQFGCDSIVTYHVEIHTDQTYSLEITACHSYTTPDSLNTWNESGIYPLTMTTSSGCDSIVIYDVEIYPHVENSYTVTTCEKYTTPDGIYTWNASGVYEYGLLTSVGCDSSITVYLEIEPLDVSVIQSQISLIANLADASYQWIDCATGELISGQTSREFVAAIPGMYAAILQLNDCTDTTACYETGLVLVDNQPNTQSLRLYPNPVRDQIFFDYSGPCEVIEISLYDPLGRLRLKENISTCESLLLPPYILSGVYYAEVKMTDTTGTYRLMVD